jgi:hypothetical protein
VAYLKVISVRKAVGKLKKKKKTAGAQADILTWFSRIQARHATTMLTSFMVTKKNLVFYSDTCLLSVNNYVFSSLAIRPIFLRGIETSTKGIKPILSTEMTWQTLPEGKLRLPEIRDLW